MKRAELNKYIHPGGFLVCFHWRPDRSEEWRPDQYPEEDEEPLATLEEAGDLAMRLAFIVKGDAQFCNIYVADPTRKPVPNGSVFTLQNHIAEEYPHGWGSDDPPP